MIVAEIKIAPVGTDSASMSSLVVKSLEALEEQGLKYQVTPTSTVIEGEADEVFRALRKAHEAPFASGADRVMTSITIDERRDKELSMEGLVSSVFDDRLV